MSTPRWTLAGGRAAPTLLVALVLSAALGTTVDLYRIEVNEGRLEPVTELPGFDDPQRRVLAATIDGLRVVDLYVPNGSEVGSDKYEYKLGWLAALREEARRA